MTRAKRESQLRRRGPTRQPYDRVLIACEDSVAAPKYLRLLIRDIGIHTANCVFAPHGGSAPINVVDTAITEFEKDRDFDQVFCVIDKDTHTSYGAALLKLSGTTLSRRRGAAARNPVQFHAIPSIPCFEFWLLLHFDRCTAPLPQYRDVLPRLRACPGFEGYDKGTTDSYALTRDKIEAAIANAAHVNAAAAATATDNPTTQMNKLVLALQQIKS